MPDSHPTTDRLLVSAAEAARLLSISPRTLWSMTASGELPHVRVRRRVLYAVDDLRRWIDGLKERGCQP